MKTEDALQKVETPTPADAASIPAGLEQVLERLVSWREDERRQGTLLPEETLWRETYLAWRRHGDVGDTDPRLAWASLATEMVFGGPTTPRNETEAARHTAGMLDERSDRALLELARQSSAVADRWDVDRTKVLGLLGPGLGFPWMFPRALWNSDVVSESLAALLAPLPWAPGEEPDAATLSQAIGNSPQELFSSLVARAPEDSDLARMLSATASWTAAMRREHKDVGVTESHSFLSALVEHGVGEAEVQQHGADLLGLRNALLLLTSYHLYHAAERAALGARDAQADEGEAALAGLQRAANIYKRLCVAQMYPDRLLDRYQAVSREVETVRKERELPDTRSDHVLLVTTMNSPGDLQRLLQSVMHELIGFGYGRRVHVIISDDSTPDMREENARLIAQAKQAGLSISHWDLEGKNRFLDELNERLFTDGGCDVRNLAGVRRPGEKGVPYGRFRNFLRLVALREVKELGLDKPILTWLDQDNQIGALVLTKSGALSKRHVFNYFDQKSSIFSEEDLRVAGGGYTNDALEGVEKFWVAWGILHQVFGIAEQHLPDDPPVLPAEADITRFRPWDQADTLERLPREGETVATVADQVLLLFSTLLGTFRGKYDNQVQIYHPWSFGYVEPGEERLVEEMRSFAGMPGGNTSFDTEVLASPIPFITVGGRGEDIFHLWQLEAELGTGSIRLTHTPALHSRNVRSGRSDLMAEIIDSFNGRIFREPPYLWAALARLSGTPDERWADEEEVERDTAANIENLRAEAKASMAAVSGFAAALEPYLDENNNDYWWLQRAETDPAYREVITELREVVAQFKDAERYHRQADEKLLTLEDVKELTEQFLSDYPHWQRVVEHVRGEKAPAVDVASAVPAWTGGRYGPLDHGLEERKPGFAGTEPAEPPALVEPVADPPWQEVLDAARSLFHKFEQGRAEADSLLDWDERITRLAEIYRHYADLVDDHSDFVWTLLFRDALLVPHTAPYVAVTQLLDDDFRSLPADERAAEIGRLAELFHVDEALLRQAADVPQEVPASR